MIIPFVRVKEARCPGYGKRINAATRCDGAAADVRPNDVTLCVWCYQPMVFTDDGGVRAMTTEEFAALPQEMRDDYDEIVSNAKAHERREEERRARS